MKRVFLTVLMAGVLGGCGDLQWPIVGELDGMPAQGTVVANFSGEGRFSVTGTSGLNCQGNYDPFDRNLTITAPVSCNDGQTGTALITRKTDLLSGTAIIRLSGGKVGRFVFGDLSFAEEFT